MNQFREGELVKIPCKIQQGAFPEEYLVTIETDDKEISGFVRKQFVTMTGPSEGYIKAKIIVKDSGQTTLQLVQGSLFTGASGKTSVSNTWADHHLAAAG